MQCIADSQWRVLRAMALALIFAGVVTGETDIDPVDKFGWGENIGFLNFRDANGGQDGVEVGETYLMGYIWSENTGWINVGDGSPADGVRYANTNGSDFGVNLDENGDLHGYAWGENIGWINFDTRPTQGPNGQQARLDTCGNRLRGFAWGENIGWITLDESEHFVALGPDCHAGDIGCDGTIALVDYATFQRSLTGPGVGPTCRLFDFDGDFDVDLGDFGCFQSAFIGE
jgi:hypothetical protein